MVAIRDPSMEKAVKIGANEEYKCKGIYSSTNLGTATELKPQAKL
jgi:hypothetical protein